MMKHGLLNDRVRVIKKPPENYLTEGPENVAESSADYARLRNEELRAVCVNLRSALLNAAKQLEKMEQLLPVTTESRS